MGCEPMYAYNPPGPYAFCPLVDDHRALFVVAGLHATLVLALVAINVGVLIAAAIATVMLIGALLLIDEQVPTAPSPRQPEQRAGAHALRPRAGRWSTGPVI